MFLAATSSLCLIFSCFSLSPRWQLTASYCLLLSFHNNSTVLRSSPGLWLVNTDHVTSILASHRSAGPSSHSPLTSRPLMSIQTGASGNIAQLSIEMLLQKVWTFKDLGSKGLSPGPRIIWLRSRVRGSPARPPGPADTLALMWNGFGEDVEMCRVMQAFECEARGQDSCQETQEELEGGRNCFWHWND